MSNQSPDDFVKNLPVASTAPLEIASGVTSLPTTALLGEAERNRLQKMAEAGEQPVERPSDKEETLALFEDGATVKWLPRPGSPTQCLIVDASGKHLAIAKDSNIADFISNAINTFVVATAQNNNTDNPIQILKKPILLPEQ